ncbi:sensor histidine kinase [Turicimonas muris]|uniref:sensor histidine kinase n=1 Tax=Turicimonas muris TaxID=1796652 RepID=UPI002495282A|nr:ATP-binding protein [Turicimonas muris]
MPSPNPSFSVPLPTTVKVRVEEQMIQKDFRGYLTRAITWTALMPLFMLAFMHLNQIQRENEENDVRQIAVMEQLGRQLSNEIETIRSFLDSSLDSLSIHLQNPKSYFKEWAQTRVTRQTSFNSLFLIPTQEGFSDKTINLHESENLGPGDERLFHLLSQKFRHAASNFEFYKYTEGTQPQYCFGSPVKEERLLKGYWLTTCVSEKYFSEVFEHIIGLEPFSIQLLDSSGQSFFQKPIKRENFSFSPLGGKDFYEEVHEKIKNSPAVWRTDKKRNEAQVITAMKVSPGDLLLAVGQPLAIRDRQLLSSLTTSGIFLLVAILAAFVVGTVLGRQLNEAVHKLIEQFSAFEKTGKISKMDDVFKETAPLELQLLSTKFEEMAATVLMSQKRLESVNEALSEQVEKRTASLNQRKEELKSLQLLLAPLEDSVDVVIAKTINRFKDIFTIPTLFFSKEMLGNSVFQYISVKANDGSRLGYLYFDCGDGNPSSFASGPFLRLAHSIAIVMDNQEMYSSLKTSASRFTALMESMTEGVILVGKTGSLLYGNKAARGLLGLMPKQEVLNFEELFSSLFRSSELGEEGFDKQEERPRRYSSTTDSDFFIETSAFNVPGFYGFSGRRRGLLIRDISQDIAMERMKKNLVSMVAHELKTPVTTMRLQVETLQRQLVQRDTEFSHELLSEMLEESSRLQRLVEDWLDMSRIEAGSIVLRPKIYSIRRLLDQAIGAVRQHYPELKITTQIQEGAEFLKADKDRLIQVFINIFGNAARYRSKLEPVCRVTVRLVKDEIEIAFQDNGIGVKENYLSKIFDSFYQVEMGSDRKVGGTGLGLAICRGIMTAHGGRIWAERNKETGTTFKLRLAV